MITFDHPSSEFGKVPYTPSDVVKFFVIPGRIVKIGNITILMDQAPQHKAKIVTEWLDESKDCVKVLWLPPGTPELRDETVLRDSKEIRFSI